MPIVTFTKAVRTGSHVLIGITGESGCGKTYSALLLGRGLVGPSGKLGVIDTETGRGKIYAETVPNGYLYGELTPPFTPERYIEAISDAEAAGIECLIIDSMSHEWEGLGGILEIADSGITARGDELKGLAKWAKPKMRHKTFIQKLLTTRMHLIFCLRAKEKLVQQGKDIVSAGFAPIQDKRFIYEMTINLFLPNEGKRGVPQITKCPGDLLGAFSEGKQIGTNTGAAIAQWVSSGAPINHELEAVKREAEELAGKGTAAFRTYWKELPPEKRAILKAFTANLQSIAQAADEEDQPQSTLSERLAGQKGRNGFHPANTESLPGNGGEATQTAPQDEPATASTEQVEAVKETLTTAAEPEATVKENLTAEAEPETDEMRDEYLPVQIDAAKDADTIADLDAINTSVRATLAKQERNDLLGEWNAAYLDRKRTLATLKSANKTNKAPALAPASQF